MENHDTLYINCATWMGDGVIFGVSGELNFTTIFFWFWLWVGGFLYTKEDTPLVHTYTSFVFRFIAWLLMRSAFTIA